MTCPRNFLLPVALALKAAVLAASPSVASDSDRCAVIEATELAMAEWLDQVNQQNQATFANRDDCAEQPRACEVRARQFARTTQEIADLVRGQLPELEWGDENCGTKALPIAEEFLVKSESIVSLLRTGE